MRSGFREGEWGSLLERVFSHRVGRGRIFPVKELEVQRPSAHSQPLWALHGRRLVWGVPGSWGLRCLEPASQKGGSAWVLRLQRKAWNILTGVETDRLGRRAVCVSGNDDSGRTR